jgi:hypothetical protein
MTVAIVAQGVFDLGHMLYVLAIDSTSVGKIRRTRSLSITPMSQARRIFSMGLPLASSSTNLSR